jgi:CRISPR-associated protein Cmr2
MSNQDEFWALKIVALLHDPPGKVLDLSGHEVRAFTAIERIIGTTLFQHLFGVPVAQLQTRKDFKQLEQNSQVFRLLKRADAMSSAIDRAGFPGPVKLDSKDYVLNPKIAHPLSGQQKDLKGIPSQFCDIQGSYDQKAADAYQVARLRDAEQLAQGLPDLRSVYLRLWRELPSTSLDVEAMLLPPDTRIIDHTLWQHLDATAAMLTALPKPATLIFGVGPVQSFIAEARRTQDLWMGSYILSYLTWCGIQRVVEEYGPDAVLYPTLRGQPLMDHWLQSFTPSLLSDRNKPTVDELAVATIPNKFMALLPERQAATAAQNAVAAVQEAWLTIADAVKGRFPGGALGGDWDAIWRRQVEARDWPETYWSALSWPDTTVYSSRLDEAKAALKIDEDLLSTPSRFRPTFNAYGLAWPTGVNSGTLYGRLHAVAEAGFVARKGLRNFMQPQLSQGATPLPGEDGEKCTVSGNRSALRPEGASRREEVRRYWQGVAQELRSKHRYHEVKPDGSERLSAIVAVKRFAQRDYFEDAIGLQGGFPSTSLVAAAPFKAAILERLAEPALASALSGHLKKLKQVGFPQLSSEAARLSLPRLGVSQSQLPAPLSDLGWDFLRFDADVLYPSIFTAEQLQREYGIAVDKDTAAGLAESCRRLLRAAQGLGIDPPAKYYAVVLMDGDQMGAWLSGEKMPPFQQAFHPDVIGKFSETQLGTDPQLVGRLAHEGSDIKTHAAQWEQILQAPRPLSTALHNSMSLALANFALECARQVVEGHYLGRVVYAGGDDLMALLPAEYALAAVRDLRALYSGQATVEVGPDGWQVTPDFGHKVAGFLHVGETVLLTMGPTATASAGIAIAHHQAPLDGVLAAAREAEHAAKEIYERNAVCVYALKRSGEALRVGSRWFYDQVTDPIGKFGEFRGLLQGDRLSSKLAYEALVEARALIGLPDAHQSTLKRLLKRHKGTQFSKEDTETWAEQLARWSQALNTHRVEWEQQWPQLHDREPDPVDEDFAPQPGPIELGKWLLLARFLETGGEE